MILRIALGIAAATFSATGTGASSIIPWPTRQLEWKAVNVLSISDSHGGSILRLMAKSADLIGWLLGHQHVRASHRSLPALIPLTGNMARARKSGSAMIGCAKLTSRTTPVTMAHLRAL